MATRRQFLSLLNNCSMRLRQCYFSRSRGAGSRRLRLAGVTFSISASVNTLADGVGIIALAGQQSIDPNRDHAHERAQAHHWQAFKPPAPPP